MSQGYEQARPKRFGTLKYMGKRILLFIPLLLGVIVFNFGLIHLAPGDPVNLLVGEGAVSQETIDRIRAELGLDKPLPHQLLIYLGRVVRLDLGTSYVYRTAVLDLILARVPATILLMGTAQILGTILGVLVGVYTSTRVRSRLDSSVITLSLVGYSMPVFWLALIAIMIFSISLGWFPSGGLVNVRGNLTGLAYWIDVGHHLVLPVSVLTVLYMALILRMTRASMLEVLNQDFITTARAKGITERRVVFRHALPNALLPVVTVIGINFGFLLSGAVLTETVFAWPGLGRLMFQAVGQRDYPVMLGMLIFTAFIVVIANLLTDLVYVILDPRIRYE